MSELRDYGGIGGVIAEAQAIEDELKQRDRVGCPKCGLTLDVNSEGAVSCPMGHYQSAQMPKELP